MLKNRHLLSHGYSYAQSRRKGENCSWTEAELKTLRDAVKILCLSFNPAVTSAIKSWECQWRCLGNKGDHIVIIDNARSVLDKNQRREKRTNNQSFIPWNWECRDGSFAMSYSRYLYRNLTPWYWVSLSSCDFYLFHLSAVLLIFLLYKEFIQSNGRAIWNLNNHKSLKANS